MWTILIRIGRNWKRDCLVPKIFYVHRTESSGLGPSVFYACRRFQRNPLILRWEATMTIRKFLEVSPEQ